MEIDIFQDKFKEKEIKPSLITTDQRNKIDELGFDYWDNKDFPGYQGHYYDGRWIKKANQLQQYYNLNEHDKVLDYGCGKGFLLQDIQQVVGCDIVGYDKSEYAIDHSQIKKYIIKGSAEDRKLPFADNEFSLVLCLSLLYAIDYEDCVMAIKEIERVGKEKFIVINSFRNEKERINLVKYDATAKIILNVFEWKSLLRKVGYSGQYYWIIFT
jgi:ubiquinone/menaquinone biosynthesis C-methylase UbiE